MLEGEEWSILRDPSFSLQERHPTEEINRQSSSKLIRSQRHIKYGISSGETVLKNGTSKSMCSNGTREGTSLGNLQLVALPSHLLSKSRTITLRKLERILAIAGNHFVTWLWELEFSIGLGGQAAIVNVRHQHQWPRRERQR